jgi:hypothetical protein
MNLKLLIVVTIVGLVTSLPAANAQTTYTSISNGAISPSLLSSQGQTSASELYWFQAGVIASRRVTGASVEIRVLTPQKPTHGGNVLAYWVGVDLANDAFIQVGYWNYGAPWVSWFFAYFPPGTAKEASGGFQGTYGNFGYSVANGSWVKFTLQSSGTAWEAYVNTLPVGYVNLQLGIGNRVSAIAEVAGTQYTDERLGPVEFRNLAYRDSSGSWQPLEAPTATVSYGAGSSAPSFNEPYYVFAKAGVNNYWLAGSGLGVNVPYCAGPMQTSELCIVQSNYNVGPWYNVQVVSEFGGTSGSGWYLQDDSMIPQADVQMKPINSQERFMLTGWLGGYVTIPNGEGLVVASDMTLTAVYSHQFFVNVTSPFGQVSGSGWYNQGSMASLEVTPNSIPAQGLLGLLHVRTVFEGWRGDFHGNSNPSSLTVDSPKHVVAVWGTDYGLLPLFMGAIIASFILLVVLTFFVLTTRKQRCRPQLTRESMVSDVH